MTRNPLSRSFEGAASLARALRRLLTPRTAVVATGDLVHYGRGYDVEERVRTMPTDVEALRAFFAREVEGTLRLALEDRDYEAAFARSEQVLRSDQRHLLPVLAELLGTGAGSSRLALSPPLSWLSRRRGSLLKQERPLAGPHPSLSSALWRSRSWFSLRSLWTPSGRAPPIRSPGRSLANHEPERVVLDLAGAALA
jgi:hypothetical protein